ncbi:MsnO8 family LLM class oxidoreductase [Sphingobacterium sp. DK4209]|uniref:Luciferase-like monooxygenase n=1 Tax=Sphingobacterium zhuxiongii TaxID=2662364 RepID=A0A5Q0QER6_9SPHI|nr:MULTISPECIES: LLM class flavin-dependent oxidoreductase [unclassified Sphingobacterium]MVZ65094.1 MsnO8 family LLM class oxidoreductase [Sphingobacterium sp. DK4209]QGA26042.1 MsnO8 family LLM class oxidoreductase [Sphingobacterium sp. dk4302]
MEQIKYSLLELANVAKNKTVAQAIERAKLGAQCIDNLGYTRIWLAEHHNMEFVASSATSVLIGHIASHTKNIRVGSGGVMLPNHSPLVIAEQFGTLESIYPGRIDLGLGRAPGTDQGTAMALRRNNINTQFYFRDDVLALQQYFSEENAMSKVRAFPGEGCDVPIWILGSSTDSAYLAAELGLPYAFAAHFAPAMLQQAALIYRTHFKPSVDLQEPYFMVCANVVAADTQEAAELLANSLFNMFAGIITNRRLPLSAPTEKPIYAGIAEIEQAVSSMTSCTFIGTQEKIAKDIKLFAAELHAKEFMVTNNIFDDEKRLRAFKIIADAFSSINQ